MTRAVVGKNPSELSGLPTTWPSYVPIQGFLLEDALWVLGRNDMSE
jgi:hypothetical protein